MRTIGVSWLTKDWIASTRFVFGIRFTIRISTLSMAAIAPPPLALADGRRLNVADRMNAPHDRPAGRLVMMVVGDLSDQSKAVHNQDAVGERDHFRHVAGDEKNGGALAGDLADELMQVGLGLDVDADRRLVDDEDLGLSRQPFGDRNLLLVSAGEIADDLSERRRADVEALDEGGDGARLAARIDEPDDIGETPPDGDGDIAGDRMHEDEPLLLAVLAYVAHAKSRQGVMHVANAGRLSANQQLAA